MAAMDHVQNRESDQDENHENQEQRFAAAEKWAAGFAGAPAAEMLEQHCNAPENQEERPVGADQMTEAEFGMETMQEEQAAEKNQQQASEDRILRAAGVAQEILTWRCGLPSRRVPEREGRGPGRSGKEARGR